MNLTSSSTYGAGYTIDPLQIKYGIANVCLGFNIHCDSPFVIDFIVIVDSRCQVFHLTIAIIIDYLVIVNKFFEFCFKSFTSYLNQ